MITPLHPQFTQKSHNLTMKNVSSTSKLSAHPLNTDAIRFGSNYASKKEAVAEFLEAARKGDVHAVRGFINGPIARGELKINAQDECAATALHNAVNARKADVVKVLLEAGANPNIADCLKKTPLYDAAETGMPEIVQLLIQAKAKVNAKTWHQWTPLHNAAFNGKTEIVKTLLDAGANPKLKTKDGDTPFQVAVKCEKYGVAEQLLKAEGKLPDDLCSGVSQAEIISYLKAMAVKVKPWHQTFLDSVKGFLKASN